jgi:hypothetical protein
MKQPTNVDTTLLKQERWTIETVISNLNLVGPFEHLGIRTMSGIESQLEALLTWHNINVHKQISAGRSGFKIVGDWLLKLTSTTRNNAFVTLHPMLFYLKYIGFDETI